MLNKSFKFQGSSLTGSHIPSHAHTNTITTRTPALLSLSLLFFLSVPLCLPSLPKASFKEYTHHSITLMNLVGFSRRGRPPRNAKTNAPCPPRLPPLMFKVMQGDRLIKRRLRDALRPSLSHHDGSVTSGSRVLQLRGGGRRMKMVPQEHPLTYIHTNLPPPLSPTLSRRHHSSAGFTIVQVFTERRLGHVLIKQDIYSGTVAKSHGGEWDLQE